MFATLSMISSVQFFSFLVRKNALISVSTTLPSSKTNLKNHLSFYIDSLVYSRLDPGKG